jgi:hypothetical protein
MIRRSDPWVNRMPSHLSRRQFVATSLGVLAAGCSAGRQRITAVPAPQWPEYQRTTRYPSIPPQQTPVPTPAPLPPRQVAGLQVVPRSAWSRRTPVASRINPMGSIGRMTVHHEGWEVVNFTDTNATMQRLRQIENYHVDSLKWGDVGYHFIIDRSGRIWEGRAIQYQGAHVKNNNEHNIGVMVLGNFDQQYPSAAQVASLRGTLSNLRQMYRVPFDRIYTHQELNPTKCPGSQLQHQMVSLRRGGYIA